MPEEIALRPRYGTVDTSQVQEQDRRPPPRETNCCKSFARFLWDSEKKLFMRRTGLSWVKILLFYCLFYAAICALFAACWSVFYTVIDHRRPHRVLEDSRISSPGLSYRPQSKNVDLGDSTLLIKGSEIGHFVHQLQQFLEPYLEDSDVSGSRQNCHHNPQHPYKSESEPSCAVNWVRTVAPECTVEHQFGYTSGQPCIFLKLNKIIDWHPEFYEPTSLPSGMPQDLVQHISSLSPDQTSQVWVSCEGESEEDRKHLGNVTYLSPRGFPGYYFPFTNTPDYLSPLLAIQLRTLAANQLVNIECRAWAKNIAYDRKEGRGNIRFQVHLNTQ